MFLFFLPTFFTPILSTISSFLCRTYSQAFPPHPTEILCIYNMLGLCSVTPALLLITCILLHYLFFTLSRILALFTSCISIVINKCNKLQSYFLSEDVKSPAAHETSQLVLSTEFLCPSSDFRSLPLSLVLEQMSSPEKNDTARLSHLVLDAISLI